MGARIGAGVSQRVDQGVDKDRKRKEEDVKWNFVKEKKEAESR